jgi:hypothetical protein
MYQGLPKGKRFHGVVDQQSIKKSRYAEGRVGLLPRSGYTEQPRALALGQVISKRCRESGGRC